MKTPTSDPSGQHADELKAQIDAAIEKEDIDEVVNLSIHATWVTAVAICQEAGIPAPRLVGLSQLGRFLAFRDACDAHLEKATDHRITFAREAFEAIAMVEAQLRVSCPTLGGAMEGDAARLLLLGKRLGHSDIMLAMVTSGIWKDYGEALLSIHNTGSYRRGFVPKWESAFLPVAIEYCSGKAKVPLADLRRHAEKWAASEVASGRNPEFPGTEKGVLDGLKRMESSGRLIIPGRREGT
jgi:hypothetical protein